MYGLIFGFFALTALAVTSAKEIVITVGNTTQDATKVFHPNKLDAHTGDVIFFNFTQGNHTVTQSTFAAPCVPAHLTNATINGFDSSFRDAGNGQAITNLQFTIDDSNKTIWFFDWNTCGQGGVGGININNNGTETLEGFQRNAKRLNGTSSSSSSTGQPTAATGTSNPSSSSSSMPNGAPRAIFLPDIVIVIPVLFISAIFC